MAEISANDARRLALGAQGLLRDQPFGRGRAGSLAAIEHLGYVQIDTISVVERAHHHVLMTRVPNYQPAMTEHLLARDRSIFEYWSHAAAFLPIRDFRFYLPMMNGFKRYRPPDRKVAKAILERITTEGPLQSRDFEAPKGKASGGWWDWKPAKLALELLFLGGDLMISKREGFQKTFDLTERVLPANVDTRAPGETEWFRFIVRSVVRAHGVASLHDIGYARTTLRKFYGRAVMKDLVSTTRELVEAGELVEVQVAGSPWYSTQAALEDLPIRLGKRRMTILSPFDNVVINRRRALALFDFDYLIECYTPEPKRRFGYFCLPVLWGDQLIGRLDAKAHRKQSVLEVKALYLEAGIKVDDALTTALKKALTQFAANNGCERWEAKRTEPATLIARL